MNYTEEDYWRERLTLARRNADVALDASYAATWPHVLYKPSLSHQEGAWFATLGPVCGIGKTPMEAMYAFDEAWTSPTGEHTYPKKSGT